MSIRVLAVDDEEPIVETYRMWLEEEGYQVRGASNGPQALHLVTTWQPHVVLLDQRLEGSSSRDAGLSLIRQIGERHPPTRVIVITAYASAAAVARAFAEGVDDYLEKRSEVLEHLLRIKVRHAAHAAERAMEGADLTARESALHEAWNAARSEADPQRKGALLEDTVRRLMESLPGLTHARTNAANELEEIDVIVANRSPDPLLSRQGTSSSWSARTGRRSRWGQR